MVAWAAAGAGTFNGSTGLDRRWGRQQGGVRCTQIGIAIDGAVARINAKGHGIGHYHMGGGRCALVAAATVGRGANHRSCRRLQTGQTVLLAYFACSDDAARQTAAAAVG